ncbi:hypothetical protein EON65_15875 [archaeon]|nr:MAG: hypothetical protein EON65_15875 [archaeon]
MWVGALLDSLDQLLSSQNIRLHNGVAVHAPSLAVSRAPSFRSVDTSYSNTSAYDGRENRLCYPMVRIFYLLHILHYLAMDSSHVREVLSKELVSHWSSVMSIFQIICPHQSMNVKVAQNDCLNSARKPSFQRQESISSSAPNSVRLSGREVFIKDSPFRKLSRSESRRSILTNVLASSMSRMLSTRGSFKQPNVPSLNFSSIIEEAPVANEPIIDNTRSSTAFSCGALPRHGLSVAAWRLLVICRLRCEALIFDVLKIPESSILASKESILPEPSAEGDGDDELLMNLPPIHPAKLKRTGLQVSTADNGGTDIDTAVNTLSGSIAAITSPSAAEGRKSARFIVPDDERRGSLNESEKQLPSPIYSESPSATRKRVRMFSE